MADHLLCYEHPLNERMRSSLRLEFLLNEFHRLAGDPSLRRPLIAVICDVLSLLSRADAWSEMGKDLQHEVDALNALRRVPDVDLERLEATVQQLREAQQMLSQVPSGAIGLPKLLLAVIQRASVPGGLAPADIPAYTWWLNQPAARQQQDIAAWTEHWEAYEQALRLQLSLVRSGGDWQMLELEQGVATLQARSRHALLRLAVDPGSVYYPEISGGRQRLTIRLRAWDVRQAEEALGVTQLQYALC